MIHFGLHKIIFLLLFLQISVTGFSQKTDKLLLNLLQKSGKFDEILKNPKKYQTQLIYTQINRNKNNFPSFKSYVYNADEKRYFYPASTVKFPAVLLAFEKANNLKIIFFRKDIPMFTDSLFANYGDVRKDSTSLSELPSLAHYAKKILLVSDNDAFNRLYEFMGQEPFNEQLYRKGYKNLRIVHRLEKPFTKEQNAVTNSINFIEGDILYYHQTVQKNSKDFAPKDSIKLGKGFMKNDILVNKPFDFTNKNFFALAEQQAILKAVLFPEAISPEKRFNLTEEDYKFVYQYMSQYPGETTYPTYDSTEFHDSYCKFFMFGNSKKTIPKNIRIFNKVGDAYGFLLDNAYIVDFDKKIEFMVSAVIYCNEDEIFNDDKYDYETIGYPFFENLGKVIYEYESSRKKKNLPNLSKFVMKYDNIDSRF